MAAGLPTLMGRLVEHARERHAPPDGQLLRYADGGSETGAMATYLRASLAEVAAAPGALTGEPHPLATAEGW